MPHSPQLRPENNVENYDTEDDDGEEMIENRKRKIVPQLQSNKNKRRTLRPLNGAVGDDDSATTNNNTNQNNNNTNDNKQNTTLQVPCFVSDGSLQRLISGPQLDVQDYLCPQGSSCKHRCKKSCLCIAKNVFFRPASLDATSLKHSKSSVINHIITCNGITSANVERLWDLTPAWVRPSLLTLAKPLKLFMEKFPGVSKDMMKKMRSRERELKNVIRQRQVRARVANLRQSHNERPFLIDIVRENPLFFRVLRSAQTATLEQCRSLRSHFGGSLIEEPPVRRHTRAALLAQPSEPQRVGINLKARLKEVREAFREMKDPQGRVGSKSKLSEEYPILCSTTIQEPLIIFIHLSRVIECWMLLMSPKQLKSIKR